MSFGDPIGLNTVIGRRRHIAGVTHLSGVRDDPGAACDGGDLSGSAALSWEGLHEADEGLVIHWEGRSGGSNSDISSRLGRRSWEPGVLAHLTSERVRQHSPKTCDGHFSPHSPGRVERHKSTRASVRDSAR